MRTDEELLQMYYEGSHDAFKDIFQRRKTEVFNFALRFLGNRADAEDVTSDVFLQLFSKKYTADGSARLSTWLFTVARNASISRLRSQKFQVSFWSKSQNGNEYEAWEPADTAELTPELMKKKEEAALVQKAISALPEEQREAIILREYHEKNYAEISEILGCSLEKTKILIFRARETLRVELAQFIKGGQI
ncbi:MAG: RNA polymerase sigma factor [Candidatus Omnitrophica bacterium]|nr:RNA polymerase sigma factor [Candidatus Omnitrophota bacterium]